MRKRNLGLWLLIVGALLLFTSVGIWLVGSNFKLKEKKEIQPPRRPGERRPENQPLIWPRSPSALGAENPAY